MKLNSTAYSGFVAPQGERLDCSVRSLAVSACITYEGAHGLFAKAGRVTGKATPYVVTAKLYAALGFEPVPVMVKWTGIKGQGYTVAQFLKAYPKGRYVVHRRHHAFAVIDGVIHDWIRGTGARHRVEAAWRIT